MSSYLPSVKWPVVPSSLRSWTSSRSVDAGASTAPTDALLGELPPHEEKALGRLRTEISTTLSVACAELPPSDGWRAFIEPGQLYQRKRDEMLLRVLRYNLLNVEKSVTQIKESLEWRMTVAPCSKSMDVLTGATVGLPIAQVCEGKQSGDVLLFSLAEAYIRRDVDHEKQRVGIAKMFDYIVYDNSGLQANRVTVVIDFTNMSSKNVDLLGTRNGIHIYLSHFPDLFDQIFLLNYPRFVHGGEFFQYYFLSPLTEGTRPSPWVHARIKLFFLT